MPQGKVTKLTWRHSKTFRGTRRDYCIVNAPERSGLGAFVVLRAFVARDGYGQAEGESVLRQAGKGMR